MPNTQKNDPAVFGMLLFDGFSNLCLANAVEPLRAANTLAGREVYRWHFLSLHGGVVRSSSDLPVQTEALTQFGARSGKCECLCVMPSYHHREHATPACLAALRAAEGRFRVIAGLDTGSWLLAAAGLLDGRRATSHWDILTSLAETFPEVSVSEARHVIDGNRVTCGGATTTLDLMLDLIARDAGSALSLGVAAMFMIGDAREPAPRLPVGRLVRTAAAVMRRNLESPLPIARIAAAVGVSQRTLEVACQTAGAGNPRALYRTIRLEEARRWVETSNAGIAEIAGRCGYADASAMTRAFRRSFGMAPRDLRRGLG